jgi:hypothetical protein
MSTAKSDVSPPAHEAIREKSRGADPELSPDLEDIGLDGCDLGRASQFDPGIDKETSEGSNLVLVN